MSNPFNILGRKSGVLQVQDILKLPELLKALGYVPEGTVLQTYETEIEALEAGVGYGAPYIDASGQLQVVSKVKQVLNFSTSLLDPNNYFCLLVEQESYDIEDVFAAAVATTTVHVRGISDGGSLELYDSDSDPVFNTLSSLELGRGYIGYGDTEFSLTIYGAPIDPNLRRALPNANANLVGYYGGYGATALIADVYADLIGAGKVDSISQGTLVYPTTLTTINAGQAVNINTNATATQVGTTDPVARNTSI